MWLIVAPFVAGVLLGWRGALPDGVVRRARTLVTAGVVLILFTLGVRVGTDPLLMGRLPVLGAEAVVFAALTIAGSVLVVWLLRGAIEPL
ncbi:MAG TPA: LysO family transporter [bacterium]|nr:LysO family transporter [bacterium]